MEQVYQSGLLTTAFVGLCVLVIIGQLIPAVLILIGAVKAMRRDEED